MKRYILKYLAGIIFCIVLLGFSYGKSFAGEINDNFPSSSAWSSAGYNIGYRFTADSGGNVTQLGCYTSSTTNTVTLYTDGGSTLATASVNCSGGWAYANITPVVLTAGTSYRVAVRTTGTQNQASATFPLDAGNIVLTAAYYCTTNCFPNTATPTNVIYGIPDITFVPAAATTSTPTPTPPSSTCQGEICDNYPSPATSNVGAIYTHGYAFTPEVSSQITKLGCNTFSSSTTVQLWSNAGVELAETTINCASGWNFANITPVNVTAGTSYRVSVYAAGQTSARRGIISYPFDAGKISILGGYYNTGVGNFPNTSSGTSYIYGLADVVFALSPTPTPTTPPAQTPQSVTADTALSVGSYKATLVGSANPNNLATTMHFRLFTSNPGSCPADGGSGMRVPLLPEQDITLTTNNTTQQKTFTTGFGAPRWLTPSTNYWYCAYATNSAGTSPSSAPRAFTTLTGSKQPCDPATSGSLTVLESCSFTDTYDGVDEGSGTTNTATLTIGAGADLTVEAGQVIGRGTLSRAAGSTIALAQGASITQAGVWVKNADADAAVDDESRMVSSTRPSGYVRRNTFSASYQYNSQLKAASSLDCNATNGNVYRTVAGLVQDEDHDGYKTSDAASSQCVGGTSDFNSRTYYRSSTGTYPWLLATAALGGGATDCADSGLCSDGTVSSACWTPANYYPDGDGDTKGRNSASLTGPSYAQTGDTDTSVGSVSWTNAGNIGLSDNVYATATLTGGTKSQYLKATNFGFNISGTVKGVIVEVEAKSSTTVGDYSVKLVKGGVIIGEERAALGNATLSSGDTTRVYGRSDDLWGTTLSEADLNASDFGVVLSYKRNGSSSSTVSVDAVRMYVYTGDVIRSVCGGGSPPVGFAATSNDCNDADATDANSTISNGYTGIDGDGDGQAVSPVSYNYCGSANSRGTSSNIDCYDNNANTYIGQTSYFSTNRGDGSFDYNCDGTTTKDTAVINQSGAYYTSATSGSTTGNCAGWGYPNYGGVCTTYSNQSSTNCWGGDTYVSSVTGDITTSTACGSNVARQLYSNSSCVIPLIPPKYRISDNVGTIEKLGCR